MKENDLHKTVTLRQQPISVLQAIQIEVAHISYHLGQIIYIGKQIKDKEWTILSIPKNGSKEFNKMVAEKNSKNIISTNERVPLLEQWTAFPSSGNRCFS